MTVKLIVTLSGNNNNGVNFNAEIDDSEEHDDLEETLAQCLLGACISELGRIQNENSQEDD